MSKQSWSRKQILLVSCVLLAILAIIWWVSRSELEKNGLEENLFLRGKIEGAGGLQLFLEAPSDRGVIAVAQTEIEDDGSFELPANVPGLGIYNLRISDLNGTALWLPLQPKDNLTLNCSLQEFGFNPGIKGVSWANAYAQLMKQTKLFETEQQKLQNNATKLDEATISSRYSAARNQYEKFCAKTILQDLKSPLNILLSMNLLPTTGFEDWNACWLCL